MVRLIVTKFTILRLRWKTRLQLGPRLTENNLTIPEIALIAGTRVALGVGIGLLLSEKLNKDQRRSAGWALFGVGVLTTIPTMLG
jgi:hypothetical protein